MNNDQTAEIHNKVSVIDGIKIFPEKSCIELFLKPLTYRVNYSDKEPVLSIIIPSYFRLDNLFETVLSVIASETSKPYEIVIFDNAFIKDTFDMICSFIDTNKSHIESTSICSITVHKDATKTFPTLRNFAIEKLANEKSQIIASWDSDILSNKYTVDRIVETLLSDMNLNALAPPMLLKTHALKSNIYMDSPINSELKSLFDMPGRIGEELGTYYEDIILLTGILRGCFFVKRTTLDSYKAAFGEIFSKSFTVWSNVPFFIGLRELGLRFGYLYENDLFVLNNNTHDTFTMGKHMNNRVYENLKSITLLCYRNSLFDTRIFQFNETFNRLTTSHISQILQTDNKTAAEVYRELVEIARDLHNKNSIIENLSKISQETLLYLNQTVSVKELHRIKSLENSVKIYDTKY